MRRATQVASFEFVITIDGEVQGEVKDVSGLGREKLLDWIKELGTLTVDRRTPDYRQQAIGRRQQVGG